MIDTYAQKIIEEFLHQLGLNKEEARVYTTLMENGTVTVLRLSRLTNINRTRVYRLLEKLRIQGLTEEIIDAHRKLIKAVDPVNLELLVKREELRAKKLKDTLPSIIKLISGQSFTQPGTKVLFYRGKEGIRQQVWNTLKTNGEAVGYTYRPVAELIGDYYFKWLDEWIKRKLYFRDIINPNYLTDYKKVTDSLIHPSKLFATHIIPPKILIINHQIDIYNDVVSYYNWYEGEIFGVEIYNDKIAKMQKQLFEIVWNIARET